MSELGGLTADRRVGGEGHTNPRSDPRFRRRRRKESPRMVTRGLSPRAQLHLGYLGGPRRHTVERNGAPNQDAIMTTGDHRQLEIFSDGALAVAGAVHKPQPRPTESQGRVRHGRPATCETSGGSRFRAPLSPSSPAQSSGRAARRRRPVALPARGTIVAPGARQDPVRERSSLPGR
jgi:hypothetical protein